jgi:hypothetical protein
MRTAFCRFERERTSHAGCGSCDDDYPTLQIHHATPLLKYFTDDYALYPNLMLRMLFKLSQSNAALDAITEPSE